MKECVEIAVRPGLPLYHVGPPLDLGPLPSIFYFSLSGPDSLTKDPYNQPVAFLRPYPVRIFSLTLPAHEPPLSPLLALSTWADEMRRGIDRLSGWIDECLTAIEYAVHQRFADSDRIGTMGLSRGGLFALHVAARSSRVKAVSLFAPLLRLALSSEFADLADHPFVQALDLAPHIPLLAAKPIRISIGNRDTRVSTRAACDFALCLSQAAHEGGIRTPPIELILTPSIGQHGHGTSLPAFQQGAAWLRDQI